MSRREKMTYMDESRAIRTQLDEAPLKGLLPEAIKNMQEAVGSTHGVITKVIVVGTPKALFINDGEGMDDETL